MPVVSCFLTANCGGGCCPSCHSGRNGPLYQRTFFRCALRDLARALHTHGAWVTEYLPESRRFKARAFSLGGQILKDYEPIQSLTVEAEYLRARRQLNSKGAFFISLIRRRSAGVQGLSTLAVDVRQCYGEGESPGIQPSGEALRKGARSRVFGLLDGLKRTGCNPGSMEEEYAFRQDSARTE
jgi:hypothetical protein